MCIRDSAGMASGTGAQVLTRTTGKVMNPNMELLFGGPTLRNFRFQFKMTPRNEKEAEQVIDIVEEWQDLFLQITNQRIVYAADEYYLLARRPFPETKTYGDFPMHEDGIGMARAFEKDFLNGDSQVKHHRPGFFSSVDGAPAQGYRAPRTAEVPVKLTQKKHQPITVLTGDFGASVIKPLLEKINRSDVEVIAIENKFFGGNIGVTGLLVGEDLKRVLEEKPKDRRYLLPDVCLSGGRFLDDLTPVSYTHLTLPTKA